MSGTQVSSFAPANILFDAASGATTASVQNQLLRNDLLQKLAPYQVQQAQQQTGEAETEMMARAASGLLSMPDEASRAAAYPSAVADLQKLGFAKNAPSIYPGETALKRVAAMGTPSKDLFLQQQRMAALGGLNTALTGGQPAAGGATPAAVPGYGGARNSPVMPPEYEPYFQEASQKTGIPVDVLKAQAAQESGFNPGATGSAGEVGLFQIKPSTAKDPGFGMQGVDPATLRDPRSNILFGAQYLKARAGQADLTTPQGQATALTAYNGGGDPNYAANVFRYIPGGQQTAAAQPSAVQPQQQVAAAQPQAAPGAAGPLAPVQVAGPGVPTPPGPVSTAPPAQTQAQAEPPGQTVVPSAPPPAAPAMTQPSSAGGLPPPTNAPQLVGTTGLTLQQLALVRAAQADPSTNLGALTGEILRMQQANIGLAQTAWKDAHPELKQTMTGQGLLITHPQTGQVMGIIPVTPNIRATPVPGVRDGQPGTVLWQGGHEVGFEPSATRPALGTFELQKGDYEKDRTELPHLSEANQNAQAQQIRINQMRDLAGKITTGAAGNTRAAWANIAETMGMPEVAKKLIANAGAGDASAAQEFAKLGLMAAGTQERGDLGARGSLGAIQLYKAANPGLDLRPGANKAILGMQLIAAQANSDYTQGALDFANHSADSFRSGGGYIPLSHYDAQWSSQRNPQIYAAAIGAINGEPWDKWTARLKLDTGEDVGRVIDIVRRADPTAALMWKDGKMHATSPPNNG